VWKKKDKREQDTHCGPKSSGWDKHGDGTKKRGGCSDTKKTEVGGASHLKGGGVGPGTHLKNDPKTKTWGQKTNPKSKNEPEVPF